MKTAIATTILLLLGLSNGTTIKKNMSQAKNVLAELTAGVTHTCQFSINRVNAGPANFNSIIGSGNVYTDNTFV